MRKLRLESLQVESFQTVAPLPEARGTVRGHRPNTDGCGSGASDCPVCVMPTEWHCPATAPVQCPDTAWLDCTYGCTYTQDNANSCSLCWVEVTEGCTAAG
jgi:hypothetical protein